MKFASIMLLVVLLLTIQITMPAMGSVSADAPAGIVIADEPDTMLDGIDWDEWLDNLAETLLDGIDWDEWLDNLIAGEETVTA